MGQNPVYKIRKFAPDNQSHEIRHSFNDYDDGACLENEGECALLVRADANARVLFRAGRVCHVYVDGVHHVRDHVRVRSLDVGAYGYAAQSNAATHQNPLTRLPAASDCELVHQATG